MKILSLALLFGTAAACSRGDSAPLPAVTATAVAPAAKVATPPAAAPAAAPAAPVAAEPPLIAVGTKLKCPVSHEDFTVDGKTTQLVYNGKRYAFCCDDCKPTFLKNPAKYAQ